MSALTTKTTSPPSAHDGEMPIPAIASATAAPIINVLRRICVASVAWPETEVIEVPPKTGSNRRTVLLRGAAAVDFDDMLSKFLARRQAK
jgi:hypothetical protein